jgi:hypothetical protein
MVNSLGFALLLEVATGKMLGPPHDPRSFYVRPNAAASWTKTYSGPEYRPEAAGRLMNLRTAQALFHDEWMTEAVFDPDRHTQRYIDALDTFRQHGVLAINVSLQGGNPAYERYPAIRRDRPYKLGPGKGSYISAFRPDGSLKESWLRRLLALQRALDQRGMILNLLIFYQHQDELFESTAVIDRAAQNIADWLVRNRCRNVIIDVANEYDAGTYDHDRYIYRQMGRLMQILRSRTGLPVSTSSLSRFAVPDHDIDFILLHGNNRTPEDKRKGVAALQSRPLPVVMNEDNNGRETTDENLAAELASCDAVLDAGGSWGYMPWIQLQIFPFHIVDPAKDLPTSRDAQYLLKVLQHIRNKVYR